ncbi:MAG: radical SAM protein, partial [Bacteroidales bacterium]
MFDKRGRNIDYLRISLTDRCNLRCVYCMPEKGIEKKRHTEILRFEEVKKIIKACAALGIKKVRFTGGEPLILKGIDKLIKTTASIKGIEDISLTTNGMLL